MEDYKFTEVKETQKISEETKKHLKEIINFKNKERK